MIQTARDKIRELRALHDDGLLSLQEFDRRKNAILDAEFASEGSAAPVHVRQGTELGLMSGQEIGPQNRRYRLERLIGMGGMGQVWQATDLATHAELGHSEMVALKILPPQLTQSATHAKLLIEEATQARKLAHENIVRVYEWAQDPATSSYFIIMEYLEGQDLDAYLAREGPLPLEAVYRLLAPLADALQYAWDKHKLVHRDIKPGNVFLTQHGEVKLLDFGIAARVRSAGSSLGLQTPNAGTTGYRAPEAGTHQRQPSQRLDVYAVAVMIYQLLEGRMPFDDMRPADFHPSAPAGLNLRQWQALQSGFAYAQERRPASVAGLLEALRRAAGPSEEELAAQAEAQRGREQQRQKELAAQAEVARLAEQKRQAEAAELAARRHAEAQAAAAEKLRQDRLRKEQESRARAEAEAAAKLRKQQMREQLREQLQARRDADAAKAREALEDQQRKAAQVKAETAYRAEQERHRKEQAERNAVELAALMKPGTPVADPNGVLRDRFLDGTGVGPELVLVPTGRFQMGSHDHEHAVAMKAGAQKKWLERETPQHWVGIEHSFAMGRYPVTVGQWKLFVRATGWESQSDTDWRLPGFAQTDQHPVVGVSWNDAQLYLHWLSERTGQVYRLPSEAEWEYACRAGTKTAFHFGDEISTELANYDGHYTYNGSPKGAYVQGTSKVGAYPPNPWGLFDMHGNVWEWVQDVVHDNYVGAPLDGSAWEEGGDPVRRVLRGGAWLYNPRYLRAALRNGYSAVLANDIVGFRVARKLA